MVTREQLEAGLASGEAIVVGDGTRPAWDKSDAPDPALVLEAGLLRAVLVDAASGRVDPRGLAVAGAIVVGDLGLAQVRLEFPLALLDCVFTGPVDLQGATVRRLSLMGSRLAGADAGGFSLEGDGLEVAGDLVLDEVESDGGLSLVGASIEGQLALEGASLGSEDSAARSLAADAVTVGRGGFLTGLTARGTVRMSRARFGSQLSMSGAHLHGCDERGYGLRADGAVIDGDLFLNDGFTTENGAVRLQGTHVRGVLELGDADLDGVDERDRSLVVDGIVVDEDLNIRAGFDSVGAISMMSAHVRHSVVVNDATIGGADEGVAFEGFRLQAGAVYFDGLRAGPHELSLLDATVSGALMLRTDPRPRAERCRIELTGARIGRLVTSTRSGSLPVLGSALGWRLEEVEGPIGTSPAAAIGWLSGQPATQPWHELAGVFERNGQSAAGRRLRYQAAVEATRGAPPWSRLLRGVSRLVTGHGYYPLRTLFALVAVYAVALVLATGWSDAFATPLTRPIETQLSTLADPPDPAPGLVPAAWCELPGQRWDTACFEPWWQAATVAVPAAAGTTSWTARAPDAPTWLAPALALLQGTAWLLTALLVAGITGLLRRQG